MSISEWVSTAISGWSNGEKAGAILAYGLTDGSALAFRHTYKTSFPDDVRKITPGIEFPLAEEPMVIDEQSAALDPISTLKIEELIFEMKDRYTIVIVTHNMQQAARVSDYTAFMYMGNW